MILLKVEKIFEDLGECYEKEVFLFGLMVRVFLKLGDVYVRFCTFDVLLACL